MTGPVLETARLTLRVPEEGDLDAWAAFMADEVATRYLGGPQPRFGAWRGLAGVRGSWGLHGFGMFSVIERETGHWIGRIGPWRPDGWPGTEVGWGMARTAWGKGYATEAAAAAVDFAFDVLGWTEVVHVIDPENKPSQGVARRLGSINRGPTRLPEPLQEHRVDLWGQTAETWRTRTR